MFFPSLPFMGVMLFPSFVLGNASREGGVSLAPLSLFFFLLLLSFPFFLPLSSSPAFSFASLFLLSVFLLCPYLFSSFLPITLLSFFFFFFYTPSIPFLLLLFSTSPFPVFFSFCLSPLSPFFFFFFEEIACTECFSRCNQGHH